MRILIIDNDILDWLVERLEGKGDEIVFAQKVEDARQLIANQKFDLALVDVIMAAPQESDASDLDEEAQLIGLKLCKEILAKDSSGGKVAVYTALDETQYRQTARKVGLDIKKVTYFGKEKGSDGLLAHLDNVRSTL